MHNENGIQAEQLRRADLFQELGDEDCAQIAARFETHAFAKGDYLFLQGQNRQALFLILEGEAELIDESLGAPHIYMTVGPGAALGEPLLIETEGVHSLTAKCKSNGVVARMTESSVRALEQELPRLHAHIVAALARLLAGRLAYANRGDRGFSAEFRPGRFRTEHDLLGDREIPYNVLWGVQTLRAMENFHISGVRLAEFPEMIESLALIKHSCASANAKLGMLDSERCEAIQAACSELRRGMWHGHFQVDMIQGGAGTSANMNANEVIANRALALLGRELGDYAYLHPNNHVNMSQSTNDVYPSAIKLTLLVMTQALLEELDALAASFLRKSEEFKNVIKMGRTQLQDAVPLTLGQEFAAWGVQIRDGGARIHNAMNLLRYLNLGGTAIGTGINADPRYPALVIQEINHASSLGVTLAPDLVEETQDTSAFVELAGVFKMLAVRLSKICNDLRLLSSGPRTGINEINLPAVQPGSSIMPGKVNPVIPEVVNQVAFQVIGLDTAIAMAAEGGQLELNVFEPLMAFNLFSSIRMLRNAMFTLRTRCVGGITANVERCRELVHGSIGIVTALNPALGYERTSRVAREALESGRPVYDIVLEAGYLSREELDRLLSPESMTRPRPLAE